MVRPSQQRTVIKFLGTAYPISERRACRTVRCARTPYRYQSHRYPRTALHQRMTELARVRVRYGYRKIRVLLNRECWAVGKGLVYRLYREEGLTLRNRPRRRLKTVVTRAHWPPVTTPNDAWTPDFVADQLANRQRIRAFTMIDMYTRESLAIEVGQRLRSEHVVAVIESPHRTTGCA